MTHRPEDAERPDAPQPRKPHANPNVEAFIQRQLAAVPPAPPSAAVRAVLERLNAPKPEHRPEDAERPDAFVPEYNPWPHAPYAERRRKLDPVHRPEDAERPDAPQPRRR